MKITVADYVFQKIAEQGVRDVFMVSGGGIMYLCDALGRSPDLRHWCNYNEQGCAIAADGNARVTGKFGVALVTTGPGSTNALTGIAGAWVDSIPIFVISGQVRTALIADYSTQRQVGPQEINIIPMAAAVTKHAVMVTDPAEIRYEVEKCLHLLTSGRPGPVWLTLPLDVQSAEIDPECLRGYQPEQPAVPPLDPQVVDHVAELLSQARRPLILGGFGIALGGARRRFVELVEQLQVPVATSIAAMDLLPENHPQFQGRFGPIGQRRANFAVQNADLVLAIGTSLSISCIGFNDNFAPKARIVMVNIDAGDLVRDNVRIDETILADAGTFIDALAERMGQRPTSVDPRWPAACAHWKETYPTRLPEELTERERVDAYLFYDQLSAQCGPRDIVISGNSLDPAICLFQNFAVRDQQMAFTSSCWGSMGWDIPALVGAAIADQSRRAVLVTGDGSAMFNIQDLLVLGQHHLNAKVFICNNDGYEAIRTTQNRYFAGRFVGADPKSGVVNPDFAHLAAAFGLRYRRIERNEDLVEGVAEVFADQEPWLVELAISPRQQRFRVTSFRKEDGTLASRPLEDMDPLLPREEVARNMAMFEDGP